MLFFNYFVLWTQKNIIFLPNQIISMFVFPFCTVFIAFVKRVCAYVCLFIYVCVCPPACLLASVGMEGPMSHRAPLGPPSAARFHRRRTSGTRDERYRSGTETTPA